MSHPAVPVLHRSTPQHPAYPVTGPSAQGSAFPGLDPHRAAAAPTSDQVVVVVLADMADRSTLWGWSRLVLQRWPLRRVPGLCFAKVLGSGHGGGFSLRPSRTRQGLFLVFDGEAAALQFADSSKEMAGYRLHSTELLVALLRPFASKGSWSGTHLQPSADVPTQGPVAALTRAAIRPRRVWQFWRMQPAAEKALANASGCLLAAGVGEAPLLRQATFTVWQDAAAMDAYARSGAHGQAIRAAYGGDYFSESMFVRFAPLRIQGRWQGVQHD